MTCLRNYSKFPNDIKEIFESDIKEIFASTSKQNYVRSLQGKMHRIKMMVIIEVPST